MKRFWREAAIAPSDGGFAIQLDSKPVRTGLGQILIVADPGLAEAIAAEWRGQGEKLDPSAMPVTRIVGAAIDRGAADKPPIVRRLANFAGTDLICYRADAPADLAARQNARWEPLLAWAEERFGGRLRVVTGIVPCPQTEAALAAFHAAVDSFDGLRLAALEVAVNAAGSLVIGLALAEGRIDAPTAADLSQLDEAFQAERWGEVQEATHSRAERRRSLEAAATVFAAQTA